MIPKRIPAERFTPAIKLIKQYMRERPYLEGMREVMTTISLFEKATQTRDDAVDILNNLFEEADLKNVRGVELPIGKAWVITPERFAFGFKTLKEAKAFYDKEIIGMDGLPAEGRIYRTKLLNLNDF